LAALRGQAHAAVHGGGPQALRCEKVAQLLEDLAGELPRGREHERAGRRASPIQALRQRYAERERLARTRRRLDEDIPTGHRVLEDEPLDRERRRYATARQRAADRA
jgi:hypothetical protein